MTAKAAGMRHAHTCAAQRQKGVALFIVITLVMLSMLLALWASRSALFNEMFVSWCMHTGMCGNSSIAARIR